MSDKYSVDVYYTTFVEREVEAESLGKAFEKAESVGVNSEETISSLLSNLELWQIACAATKSED